MNDKILFKIIDKEAKNLLQTALLLSDSKNEAREIINEIWSESLRQLWRTE